MTAFFKLMLYVLFFIGIVALFLIPSRVLGKPRLKYLDSQELVPERVVISRDIDCMWIKRNKIGRAVEKMTVSVVYEPVFYETDMCVDSRPQVTSFKVSPEGSHYLPSVFPSPSEGR